MGKSIGFIITTTCILVILAFTFLFVFLTFNSFRGGMNDAVRTQTMELSTQIVYNYESYIESIINTSVIIQEEISRVQTQEDWDGVSVLFSDILRLNNDILRVAAFDYTTRLCLASSYTYEVNSVLHGDVRWFYEAIENPTVHVFSGPYAEHDGGAYRVNVSRSIGLPDSGRGVLKIEISFQRFIELVMKSNLGDGGHITIIDQHYNIVYTSLMGEAEAAEGLAVIQSLVLGTTNAAVNGYNMSVTVDTLSNTKWRIGVFINVDKLTEIEQGFIRSTVIALIIILVAGVLIFTFVGRAITKSMRRLEVAMKTVEKSDYFRMEEVNESSFKEVSALNGRFNKMMHKIDELMGRVVAEQEAQRRSELKALQNQINPHFLYNTLESIIWVIEKEKNMEASQMIASLARLFRFGLSTDNETIPLRDEIEHVRNYLQIQKFRYSDSFDYEFDIADDAWDVMTLKLILQPIVENCIYHGIKNNIDRGLIKIHAYLEDGYLFITVADNGYGMRREKIEALYTSFKDNAADSGVGLKNVYQRVMLHNHGNAAMLIESELDEGTIVTIKEPLI
jgi:two-component system sensor histidine kinase YesM